MRDLIQQALKRRGVHPEPLSADWAYFRVPAKHPDVGDLKIGGNEREIIVSVGPPEAHSHFDEFSVSENTSAGDLPLAIAEAAADYVIAVLQDQVVIEIVRENGSIREVITYHLPRAKPPARKAGKNVSIARYVWSGPYEASGD
jgi:hypothetical protein